MSEIMSSTGEPLTLNDISKKLQYLSEQYNVQSDDFFECFTNNVMKDLRKTTLENLEKFILVSTTLTTVENDDENKEHYKNSKNIKKLMDFVWKKICYPPLSKLRPYLESSSSKALPIDSTKRVEYMTLFLSIISEFMEYFKWMENNLSKQRSGLPTTQTNDNVIVHIKETEFMCDIWCGDLYRYLYTIDEERTHFDNAIYYYKRAFLIDTNNDSSYNQLGVSYKMKSDYFLSIFYLIKGCLNTENPSNLLIKNKDLTLTALINVYNAQIKKKIDNKEKDNQIYLYGVILLVCEWCKLSKDNKIDIDLYKVTKTLQERIINNMINNVSLMSLDNLNEEIDQASAFQCSLIYVCVLLIISLEKLRKTDSTTFRLALEFFVDFIYLITRYSVAVVDRMQVVAVEQPKLHIKRENYNINDNNNNNNDDDIYNYDDINNGAIINNDDEFVGTQFKSGYLCGRRAIVNISSYNNNQFCVDSESELSNDEDLEYSNAHITAEEHNPSFQRQRQLHDNSLKINYALDRTCLDVLKIVIEWLTKSCHVIPVINEITNDDILKYMKKNIKHLRKVLSLLGLGLDETKLVDHATINNETFPEDFLVLDNYLFVESKLKSWTHFDILKKSYEVSETRVAHIAFIIDNHQIFKKGGFEELMKSFETFNNNKLKSSVNRRNKNKKGQSKTVTSQIIKVTPIPRTKVHTIVKPQPNISPLQTDNNAGLSSSTPNLCIIEYGVLRHSLYLVRKIVNNPLMIVLITSSCLNKLDYHKKNCQNVRDCAKFIEGEISTGNNRLKLQDENHCISLDKNEIPECVNKYFIPLMECALYYRKHTQPSVDVNIVLRYHDYRRIQQNDKLTKYLNEKLIMENINYINIEALTKKK